MVILVLLAIPTVFYLLPASVPIWRTFLIVWAVVGILVIIIWYKLVFLGADKDQLALLFDKALIYFILELWITAALAQIIRGWAHANGYQNNYRHWLVVVAGGVLSISLGVSVFFTYY